MSEPAANPQVVMVPGLGLGEAAMWPTMRHLAASDRLVCLPAFGRPARRRSDLSPAWLAGTVVEQLSGPTLLVGHSASCQVVAEAAVRAPGHVVGLVLIGPTTDPRSRSWHQLVQRWLRTACWERPSQVPLLVRDYSRTGLGSILRGMEAARHHDIQATLRRSSAPLLVLRGPHDRIAPADWCRTLAPDTTTTLTGGGHMIPLTHGASVAALVAEWARRVSPQAPGGQRR